MTTQEERDRAVIARIGGNLHRAKYALPWGADTLRSATEILYDAARAPYARWRNHAYLPEAAFDWPIYVEAMAALYGPQAREEATESELRALHGDR